VRAAGSVRDRCPAPAGPAAPQAAADGITKITTAAVQRTSQRVSKAASEAAGVHAVRQYVFIVLFQDRSHRYRLFCCTGTLLTDVSRVTCQISERKQKQMYVLMGLRFLQRKALHILLPLTNYGSN
jgi:hypothetical protein